MTDTPETAPEVTQDYSEQALANRQIDFLETRAEEWMSDGGVQRMFNAIASVFEPYAPQEIMDRFREKLGAIGIQCHIEGALRAWEEIAAQQKALGRPLPADADEIERHRTTPEAARQDVREALAEAYRKGATDVHTYWQRNPGEPPQGDPEFGEAASDYAAAAMDIYDSSAALSTSPLANETGALREAAALASDPASNKAGGLWYRRWHVAQTRVNELEALIDNPPAHRFWGAGEVGCPREIKAGNGELHTLRCKVCGQDNPKTGICVAALASPDDGEGK